MPVLLLCQGEKEAKNRLRGAIEARYGTMPPAIEKISIAFQGRARIKLGPVHSWVPVKARASFVFPTHLRWDFTVKPLGLPVQKGIETFDGKVYRSQRAIGNHQKSTSTDLLASARGRLWQMAAILLTPMSDYFIEISNLGENGIKAENTKLHDSVSLFLREDYTIDYSVVHCFNPETQRNQNLYLQLSTTQTPVNGLMLPQKVSAFWDNDPYFEMSPIQVNMHPDFPEDTFDLDTQIVTSGVGD